MPDNSPAPKNDTFYRDKYPLWIVLVSNSVSLAMYAIGAYIMFRAGIIFFFLYLIYIAWMEGRLLTGSCAGCYYYGKRCAFGKGRIACLVTKKERPARSIISR